MSGLGWKSNFNWCWTRHRLLDIHPGLSSCLITSFHQLSNKNDKTRDKIIRSDIYFLVCCPFFCRTIFNFLAKWLSAFSLFSQNTWWVMPPPCSSCFLKPSGVQVMWRLLFTAGFSCFSLLIWASNVSAIKNMSCISLIWADELQLWLSTNTFRTCSSSYQEHCVKLKCLNASKTH